MIRSVQRIVLLATALLVAAATPVAAQWTARTTMTFTERVKVPDLTLEPGSYIFELVDPSSSVPVVKITDKDGKKNFGVMHTVPTRRADAPVARARRIITRLPQRAGSRGAISRPRWRRRLGAGATARGRCGQCPSP